MTVFTLTYTEYGQPVVRVFQRLEDLLRVTSTLLGAYTVTTVAVE